MERDIESIALYVPVLLSMVYISTLCSVISVDASLSTENELLNHCVSPSGDYLPIDYNKVNTRVMSWNNGYIPLVGDGYST